MTECISTTIVSIIVFNTVTLMSKLKRIGSNLTFAICMEFSYNHDTVSIASPYLLTFKYIYYTAVSLWKAESPANTQPYTIDKLSDLVYVRKTGVFQANKDAKSLSTDMFCLANAVST